MRRKNVVQEKGTIFKPKEESFILSYGLVYRISLGDAISISTKNSALA